MISFKGLINRINFLKINSPGQKPLRECVEQALKENLTVDQIIAISVLFDASLEDLTNYILEEMAK